MAGEIDMLVTLAFVVSGLAYLYLELVNPRV